MMTVSMTYTMVVLLVLAGAMELSLVSKSRIAVWTWMASAFCFFMLAWRYSWLAYSGDVSRLHILGTLPIAGLAAVRVCICALVWRGRL